MTLTACRQNLHLPISAISQRYLSDWGCCHAAARRCVVGASADDSDHILAIDCLFESDMQRNYQTLTQKLRGSLICYDSGSPSKQKKKPGSAEASKAFTGAFRCPNGIAAYIFSDFLAMRQRFRHSAAILFA